MMETYGSAHPERAQIEGSGFLDVSDFDSSVLPHDQSNHNGTNKLVKGTAGSKVHRAFTFMSDTSIN